MQKICFSPGPTQLHHLVSSQLSVAIDEGILSRSHRSPWFSELYFSVKSQLFDLLGVPREYKLFFVGSATEAMERTIQNLVKERSHHFVAGSFGERFWKTGMEWGKNSVAVEVGYGESFLVEEYNIHEDTELICITQNETSAGTQVPEESIHQLVAKKPGCMFAVDVVSTCPYARLDYSLIDVAFFSIQKCFGLPAGLGVMIVSPRAIDRAKSIAVSAKGYHSFDVLGHWEELGQTPETPNILGIYLLNSVLKDYCQRGISGIRAQIDYNYNHLDDFVSNDLRFSQFINEEAFRSRTAYGLEYAGDAFALRSALAATGIEIGSGYGDLKKTQSRIANFPVHSKSDFECLISALDRLG